MFYKTKKSFLEGCLTGQIVKGLIGILVITIIAVAVTLPVVAGVVAVANLTGIPAMVVTFFSPLIAVSLLLVITGMT